MEEDYKQMSDEQRVKWHEKRRNRWENILSMMTKWDPQQVDINLNNSDVLNKCVFMGIQVAALR